MQSEEDDFYSMQPSSSGLTLSHMNNKSSVLCPETQDITSQYLVLQQLDAHQKMISRAKGCVDTGPPKSLQSYISVSCQSKKKLTRQLNNESEYALQNGFSAEEQKRPISSRLTANNSEEDEIESTKASTVHKGIQAGIPIHDFTCKTAEKISWYLEALSLGELQSQYFAFMDGNNSCTSKDFNSSYSRNIKGKKRVVKGDIMDWHRTHFVEPRKQFSPRILADTTAKSKLREMRCYNPPFWKKKVSHSHSSDTFESYDEEDNENELSQINENHQKSDISSVEEETLINKRQPTSDFHHNTSIHILPHHRRRNHREPPVLDKNEEDKYLEFLSKVTEDVLRSGVYSDKAIQQAFEFHLQFYKDDSNKEKLQSLLEQVMEGLKVTDEERHLDQNNILFSQSRPTTPPEKEVSTSGFSSDTLRLPAEFNSSVASEPVNNTDDFNLNSS